MAASYVLTLFGHTNFQFNYQGKKKVDNSGGCCRIGTMSEGKEIVVAEHPKAWVVRMVAGRGIRVPEKTLYWWSVHLERFLKFCRSAGAESSEIPEVAARLFLESLPVGGSAQDFAREQARMSLDVFIGEMVGWSWGEDRYGRVGPKFRLKANSAGSITEDIGGTERWVANDRVNGMDSPWKSDLGVSLGVAALRAGRNQEPLDAMRRALRVRHYALHSIHRALRLGLVPLPFSGKLCRARRWVTQEKVLGRHQVCLLLI
jgi:hypothetical protein